MRPRACRIRRLAAVLAAVTLGLGAVVAGCGSSDTTTTTSGSGAPGASPPTAGSSGTTTATGTPTTATTVTGSGTSAPPGSAHGLSVSPAVGSPHSVMHFAATPPNLTPQSGVDISNALSVMGPQKSGCVGVHEQGLAALPPGQTTTVSLGPSQIGGNWCPGTYTARVEILERPKCKEGTMCPAFIRVLAALGPVSFKIAG